MPDFKEIAAILSGGQPLKFRMLDDGSMVVIKQSGQKVIYPPDQVQNAIPAPKPISTPKPPPEPEIKNSQTHQTASKPKK